MPASSQRGAVPLGSGREREKTKNQNPRSPFQVCIWNIYFRKYISNTFVIYTKRRISQEAHSRGPLWNRAQ